MTQKLTFTIDLKTTDDLEITKAQKTIATFVSRLSENSEVLLADVGMEVGEDISLTEDERERLLRTIEQADPEDIDVAAEIAKSLSNTND